MSESNKLTATQQAIYDYIVHHIETEGFAPAIRDIGRHFEIRSPNGVMCHLKALEKKGYIIRPKDKARAIQLVAMRPTLREVRGLPYVGLVAAGTPIAAEEQHELIDLHDLFRGEDHVLLKVKGNSMIEDHIADGDLVVVRRKKDVSNNERVVALIDGEATLKKFHRRRDHIELAPCNGSMKPIVVTPDRDIRIFGVLVGVLRKT